VTKFLQKSFSVGAIISEQYRDNWERIFAKRHVAHWWVDVETTGLDPEQHEILEIALARTDDQFELVGKIASVKVLPQHIETADPESLAINRYDPEVWRREGVDLQAAKAFVEAWTKKSDPDERYTTRIAGHRVAFDLSFTRRHLDWPPHRLAGTTELCTRNWSRDALPDCSHSLKDLCERFGIDRRAGHTAADDVRCAIELAKKLAELPCDE